jgi:hypothetical protein
MDPTPEQVAAGHAFYTRRSLAVYDLAILGYFSRLAWRCPAPRIVAHYDRHVSANHLDVGVGTGYFLDHCRFPEEAPPRVALLDVSTACLEAASKRIARLDPEVIEASVLEPIPYDGPRFDSVGLSYVLHCLPGDLPSKAVALDHLIALANPGATVFGTTLLHDGVPRSWFARQVMARNNRHGIFSNTGDSLEGLRTEVASRLSDHSVEVVGCVGFFAGRVPASAGPPSAS